MERNAQLSEYIIQGYQYLGLSVKNDGAIFVDVLSLAQFQISTYSVNRSVNALGV